MPMRPLLPWQTQWCRLALVAQTMLVGLCAVLNLLDLGWSTPPTGAC